MPDIVLFHAVLGLRPSVLEWAERFREAGHRVHTPDLYGGPTFDDYEAGFRHVDSIGGVGELMKRTQAAAATLPANVIYAGFSNGAASAQLLAATRPGALGAVLMHGAMPLEAFGLSEWPATVPVQLHVMERDPFRQQPALDAFATSVRRAGASFDLFDYPGSGHLFADAGLAEYDANAAALMQRRVLDFVTSLAAVR